MPLASTVSSHLILAAQVVGMSAPALTRKLLAESHVHRVWHELAGDEPCDECVGPGSEPSRCAVVRSER